MRCPGGTITTTLVFEQRRVSDLAIPDARARNRQIEFPVQQRLERIVRRLHHQLEFHRRKLLLEQLQPLRQPVIHRVAFRGKPDQPVTRVARAFGFPSARPPAPPSPSSRRLQQSLSRRRQRHRAVLALEQRHAQLLLRRRAADGSAPIASNADNCRPGSRSPSPRSRRSASNAESPEFTVPSALPPALSRWRALHEAAFIYEMKSINLIHSLVHPTITYVNGAGKFAESVGQLAAFDAL